MSKFIRKRHVMYQLDEKTQTRSVYESCASISLAKKLSRELQAGGNTVEVDRSDDPKPKRKRDTGDAADKFIREAMRKEQAEKVAAERAKKGPNTLGLRKQA